MAHVPNIAIVPDTSNTPPDEGLHTTLDARKLHGVPWNGVRNTFGAGSCREVSPMRWLAHMSELHNSMFTTQSTELQAFKDPQASNPAAALAVESDLR